MRINAKERKENARKWYLSLLYGCNSKSAVVIKKYESQNPNINRVQLLACNTIGTPVVVAESIHGVDGCLYELFQNIRRLGIVRNYHENGFSEWLIENFKLYLTYNDGMVLMFERICMIKPIELKV